MRVLLLTFLTAISHLLSPISPVASAATVTGLLSTVSSAPYRTNLLITPLSTPLQNGNLLITSATTNVQSDTLGAFSVALNAGDYTVVVGQAKKDSFIISVPNTNLTFNLVSLITNALTYTHHALPEYATAASVDGKVDISGGVASGLNLSGAGVITGSINVNPDAAINVEPSGQILLVGDTTPRAEILLHGTNAFIRFDIDAGINDSSVTRVWKFNAALNSNNVATLGEVSNITAAAVAPIARLSTNTAQTLAIRPNWQYVHPILNAPYNARYLYWNGFGDPVSVEELTAVYGAASASFGPDVANSLPCGGGNTFSVATRFGITFDSLTDTNLQIWTTPIDVTPVGTFGTVQQDLFSWSATKSNQVFWVTNAYYEDLGDHSLHIGLYRNGSQAGFNGNIIVHSITSYGYPGPPQFGPGYHAGPMTPPMGWEEWGQFLGAYDENTVTNTVLALYTNGLAALGYSNIFVDTTIVTNRNASHTWMVDSNRWPHGMPWMGDFIHSHGMSFSMYGAITTNHWDGSPYGPPTNNPNGITYLVGSRGFETNDANLWASWGVDSVKMDGFANQFLDEQDNLSMSEALRHCGRNIWYSTVAPYFAPWKYNTGAYWDTTENWSGRNGGSTFSNCCMNLDQNNLHASWAGPGHFNHPDLLPSFGAQAIGLTDLEAKSLFGMWCFSAAPLYLEVNFTNLSAVAYQTFTNSELLAIDQDPLVYQGRKISSNFIAGATQEVWYKLMSDQTAAVALFNKGLFASNMTVFWTNIFMEDTTATVRDCWAHADRGSFSHSFTTNVPPHWAQILRITGTPMGERLFLSDIPGNIPNSTGTAALKDRSLTGTGAIGTRNALWAGNDRFYCPTYRKGIHVVAPFDITYDLTGLPNGKSARMFVSDLGIDADTVNTGSVICHVFVDGQLVYTSPTLAGYHVVQKLNIDLTSARLLEITGTNSTGAAFSSNDRVDWGDAHLLCR